MKDYLKDDTLTDDEKYDCAVALENEERENEEWLFIETERK